MYQGSPELLKRLDGHRVFVGVCGGIAAYKVASVVSGLVQGGAVVQVAMTDAATKFVTPLTFQSLSGRAVFTSGWDSIDQADPQHVRLAGEIDIALIAPCTMNMVSRLATGRVDDAVTNILAALDWSKTPVLLAPAMNLNMWNQPATQRNLRQLADDGLNIIQPDEGWQACRSHGPGRLPEPDCLIEELGRHLPGKPA